MQGETDRDPFAHLVQQETAHGGCTSASGVGEEESCKSTDGDDEEDESVPCGLRFRLLDMHAFILPSRGTLRDLHQGGRPDCRLTYHDPPRSCESLSKSEE